MASQVVSIFQPAKGITMTNFDQFTQSLLLLFVDVRVGLSLPLRRMLAFLTACLLDGTPAHLTALAEALPDVDTDTDVKAQRVRRFLSNPKISPQRVLPLLIHLLRPLLQRLPELILSMDRTHWKKRQRHVNILMVSVYFEGRAIPLFWAVWDRAGNSSYAQWKTVLSPVMAEFQKQAWCAQIPIIVVADREFASPRIAQWLKTTYHVDSVLRLKRSEYLCDQDQAIQLATLLQHFPRATTRHYRQIAITKTNNFLMNVTIAWDAQYDEPLIVAATSEGADQAVAAYEKRFGIEPMFKDHKSNGFDIEGTKVTDPKRIETLLIVMALAHVFCTSEGTRKELEGEAKKNAVTGSTFVQLASFSLVSKPSNSTSSGQADAVLSCLSAVCSDSWH
jgi:hypothetical protein